MASLKINNAGVPLNNINGGLVNIDTSNVGGIPFTNTTVPNGPYTLPPSANNVLSAASVYPAPQKGGKINRKKINKISRKYKMKGSKKTLKRRIKKIKSRMRASLNASRRIVSRSSKGGCWDNKKKMMKGGNCGCGSKMVMKGGATPVSAPNYPAGHSQYQNNNGALSNVYSTGGYLPANSSALANPVPYKYIANANIPDNLDHYSVNAYGNHGAGAGFPSRGWF
jgi:hypothetical protein